MSICTLQVLADAPVMDTVLPISPLDARQGRLKQEDCQELHISHSADDVDYQVARLHVHMQAIVRLLTCFAVWIGHCIKSEAHVQHAGGAEQWLRSISWFGLGMHAV